MATRELSLFADLDQGRLVQSFLSTLQATLPRFVFGDSIPVSYRPLKSNGNNSVNPWSEVDLTGKTVRIAIGNPAGAASSGTFTLTYGANTTAAIAYNADGATIQTALNALASITAAGGVVVTRATTGAFRIVFNTAGARTAITADASAIYPTSGVEIHVAVEGDGSTREITVARLETLPAAYAELTDDFPVAAADIVEVRAGSGSVGAIVSFGFSVLPYSGFYTLEIDGEQTLGIPWDADASTLQAALDLLSSVGPGQLVVSGEWPLFTFNFDTTIGVWMPTIDTTGLVVPKGRVGTLNTNTAAMIELLNGASQATAKLEIELYDIGDGTTWTVLQTDCTVIDDVIGNSPATVPPFPSVMSLIGAMTRSAFQGPPDIPQSITITAGAPVAGTGYDPSGVALFTGIDAGSPTYFGGGAYPTRSAFYSTDRWKVQVDVDDAISTDWDNFEGTPAMVPETDYEPGSGGDFSPAASSLDVAYGPQVEAAYIGQWCRVGDDVPYAWYQAETLTSWVNRTAWVGQFIIEFLQAMGENQGINHLIINSSMGSSGLLTLYSDSGKRCDIYAPIAYAADRIIELPDKNGTFAIDEELKPATSAPVNAIAGTAQVETLTLVGSASSTGNNNSSVIIGGSTYTVAVALVSGDSASTVGGKVRAALATLYGVYSQYTIGGTGATITLTKIYPYTANDSTLAINMATTRYPAQSASLNTTTGVATVIQTADTPYLRVSGGYLYVQDAGTWKRVALSTF